MTSDLCRDWRGALGAAAIGRIDPAEEIGLRAHLDGCADCRAELSDLTAVGRALAAVPVANVVGAPAVPSGELGSRVLERVAHERGVRRIRRTRRVAAGAGAFVSAAAAVVAVLLFVGSSGGGGAGTQLALRGVGGARATATLVSKSDGTQIDMKVAGLEQSHYYWLWLTGDGDHRIPAGTFSGTSGQVDLKLMAALPLDEAKRIWVTDDKGVVVLDAYLTTK